MKFKILTLLRWSKLDSSTEKSNVLVSLFAIVGMIIALIHIVVDLVYQAQTSEFLAYVFLGLMLLVYFLNENKKHLTAKTITALIGGLVIFTLVSTNSIISGTYLFFFPFIGGIAVLYYNEKPIFRNSMILFPIILVVILVAFDFQLYDLEKQSSIEDDTISFKLNFLMSISATIMLYYQIMLANREIDKKRELIADQLKDRNRVLEKTNKELDRFSYSTSHDLKAPLASISGLINLAKYDVTDSISIKYFNLIEDRIKKLTLVLKNIINLSKNAKVSVQMNKINLKKIVEGVFTNNKYIGGSSNIKFNLRITGDEHLYFDGERFEVILNNLVSNAIKYHKEEGNGYVNVDINNNGYLLKMGVTDNGIGIAKEHQKNIFDMFYRAHNHTEGSGLGLYLVKDVVEKLGGNLTLESNIGVGTSINIEFPIDNYR